jgi:hypothetical protein
MMNEKHTSKILVRDEKLIFTATILLYSLLILGLGRLSRP